MKYEFKVGDLVSPLNREQADYMWNKSINSIYKITNVDRIYIGGVNVNRPSDNFHGWESHRWKLVNAKGKPVNPDNHVRYMVYGVGCDNHDKLVLTEKELKDNLNKRVHDSGWTGDIIGYKLVPLYKAEKSVKLTSFNPVKRVRKTTAKKK